MCNVVQLSPLFSKLFIIPSGNSELIKHSFPLPYQSLVKTEVFFLSLWICLFYIHINGIMWYLSFCVCIIILCLYYYLCLCYFKIVHVVAGIRISFLWLNNIPYIFIYYFIIYKNIYYFIYVMGYNNINICGNIPLYIYCLSIHLLMDTFVAFFLLATVNGTAMNTGVQIKRIRTLWSVKRCTINNYTNMSKPIQYWKVK